MCIFTVLNFRKVLSCNFISIPVCKVESVCYIQEATIDFCINKVTVDATVNSQRINEEYFKFLNRNYIKLIVFNNQVYRNRFTNQRLSCRCTIQFV